MEKNYGPGIIWIIFGIICLGISYSGSEYQFVIRGTHISFGWFALVWGTIKLIAAPER